MIVEIQGLPTAKRMRGRSCPNCLCIWPEKTKVCNSPFGDSVCGYVWPTRAVRAKHATKAPRSTALTIIDLPPFAHLLEGDFQEPLKRALNAPGRATRVWRQNCGTVQTRDRAGKRTGQFSAGPRPGAADLSGAVSPYGIRLEVEVKVDAPHEENQKEFRDSVTRLGCIYVLVRYDHALSLIDNVAAGVAMVDASIAERVSRISVSV